MAEYDNLFRLQPTEASPDVGAAISPASEYVQHELSADLAAIRDGGIGYSDLAAKHTAVLDRSKRTIAHNRDPRQAEKSQLDLLLMLGAYLPLDVSDDKQGFESSLHAAPAELHGLLAMNKDQFGVPDRMNYEQIIDANSAEYVESGYMRTFLEGDDGIQERDFYLGHYIVEPHVKLAQSAVKSIVDAPKSIDVDEAAKLANLEMNQLKLGMQTYARYPAESFARLRPYLGSYPDGTRNASGAFMPSIQLMELRLHPPTDPQLAFIEGSMPYFPRQSRGPIAGAVQDARQGHNLLDRIKGEEVKFGGDGLDDVIGAVDKFTDFKKNHHQITKKHLPQAFENEVTGRLELPKDAIAHGEERDPMEEGALPGTAGFNIRNVLGNGVFRLTQLKEKLEDM